MKIKTILCASALLTSFLSSHAQVTFDNFTGFQINYSTPVVNGPLEWSHTVGAGSGSALLVGIAYEDNGPATVFPSSVTFGSQSFTQVGTVELAGATPGFRNAISLWYLANPTAGAANITVVGLDLTADNNNVKGYAGSFFNVGGYEQFTTSALSGSASLPFSGLPAGSAVFSMANNQNNSTTWGTSLTTPLASLDSGGSTAFGGYSLGLSGDTTVTYTTGGGRTPALGVALTPVPEPSTMALAFVGIGGLALLRKRN
jgi:hypothetical protein